MVLNRNERARLASRLANTTTCIPVGHQRELTEKEVHSQLGFIRVVIHYDENTGWSWLRGEDKHVTVLKTQLESKSLKDYTTRAVQRADGEWDRLEKKLEEEIERLKPGQTATKAQTLSQTPTTADEEGLQDNRVSLPTSAEPPHKKSRKEEISAPPGSTSQNTPPQLVQPSPFLKLPFEVIATILERCLEDLVLPIPYLQMLCKLDCVGGPIRRTLRGMPRLWTRVHPVTSIQFTTLTMKLSNSRPLSIQYIPKPAQSQGLWQGFDRFIQLVEEARDRWESVEFSVNPRSFSTLTQALELPAPLLRSLKISILEWWTDSPRSIRSQTGQPFRLLGGEQGTLRHLDIRNASCLFDPTPFPLLAFLSLAAGVRLKYQDALDFLTTSIQLKELRLVDVKFIDVAPYQLAERLVLPHLKRLVLVDRVETIGIANLYHSIRADNCVNLNLVVRGVQEMWEPKLVESIVPVVQKTFEAETGSTLRFARYQRLDAAAWEGVGATYGFRLGFIGDAFAQVVALSDFINRVLPLADGATEVNLDVGDMFSGTVRGCIAFDDAEAMPRLLPHFFNSLTVAEVVAEVVDGYLRYLRDFVAPDLRKALPALRSITLRAIPEDEVPSPPEPAVGCHLEDFIDAVSHAYYGVAPGKEVPAEKRNSMTVVLEGRFGVNASTMKALVSGRDGERAGVRVVTARAKLHCINRLM